MRREQPLTPDEHSEAQRLLADVWNDSELTHACAEFWRESDDLTIMLVEALANPGQCDEGWTKRLDNSFSRVLWRYDDCIKALMSDDRIPTDDYEELSRLIKTDPIVNTAIHEQYQAICTLTVNDLSKRHIALFCSHNPDDTHRENELPRDEIEERISGFYEQTDSSQETAERINNYYLRTVHHQVERIVLQAGNSASAKK